VYDETERAAIAADHCGMVRFETPSAQGFRMVVDALVWYCAEAGEVVRERLVDAARVLELERSREVAEALRNRAVSGSGSYPCVGTPELTPATTRVPTGLDGFSMSGRTDSFGLKDLEEKVRSKTAKMDM
jgi:hypothetical protein